MAFTRFHDDPVRIIKELDIATYSGRYALNVPGNGPAEQPGGGAGPNCGPTKMPPASRIRLIPPPL